MSTDEVKESLLRKGRRLFAMCRATDDDQCLLGFVRYNLRRGGERKEVVRELLRWLEVVAEHGNPEDRKRAGRIAKVVKAWLGEGI